MNRNKDYCQNCKGRHISDNCTWDYCIFYWFQRNGTHHYCDRTWVTQLPSFNSQGEYRRAFWTRINNGHGWDQLHQFFVENQLQLRAILNSGREASNVLDDRHIIGEDSLATQQSADASGEALSSTVDKLGISLYEMPSKDFCFEVKNGEKFFIHKIVLAARSKYFFQQFFNIAGASNDTVSIVDYDKEVIDLVVKACYDRSFDETLLDDRVAKQIVKFAEKYVMCSVLALLPETLSKHIVEYENVCSIAIRACETHDSELRQKCAEFIADLILQGKGLPFDVDKLPAEFHKEIVLAIIAKNKN